MARKWLIDLMKRAAKSGVDVEICPLQQRQAGVDKNMPPWTPIVSNQQAATHMSLTFIRQDEFC